MLRSLREEEEWGEDAVALEEAQGLAQGPAQGPKSPSGRSWGPSPLGRGHTGTRLLPGPGAGPSSRELLFLTLS